MRFTLWSPPETGASRARGACLEHLLGMSLDDIHEILSWPIAELDPFRLSVRMQVMRIVFAIGIKALLDGKLGREAALKRMSPLRSTAPNPATAPI